MPSNAQHVEDAPRPRAQALVAGEQCVLPNEPEQCSATCDRDSACVGGDCAPILVAPPTRIAGSNWILGAGPTFTLPTSTDTFAGRQQWAMGPAGVFGYKTKKLTIGVFPQYFWGIGSRGDQGSQPDASYGSFLYFMFYSLPNAWQIGFNPVITYDHKASSDNKWNVPLGLVVAKTTKVGGKPVKFQFGMEYSVVSQDDFGKRFLIKLNVIPVIRSLIKNPIFRE